MDHYKEIALNHHFDPRAHEFLSVKINRNGTFYALVAGLLLLVFTVPLWAAEDLLNTPAPKSDIAPRTVLVDVVNTGNRLVAVGARGVIVFSEDGGRSWQQADVPVYVTLTAIYFISPQQGWAVGHDGIVLHTKDGGKTWTKQTDGYALNEQVLGKAEARLEAAQQALTEASEESKEDAQIAVEDAEFALETAQAGAEFGPARPLLDVWFKNESEGFVVGSYGFIFRTTDGGANWQLWSDRMDNPEDYHYNAITATATGKLFIVGEYGTVYRSLDNGETWETLMTPYEGSYFGVLPTTDGDQDVVIIFGFKGNAFRSTDFGDTWESVNTGTDKTLAGGTVLPDGKIVIVGSSGAVLHSTDNGQGFTANVRPDRLPYSTVADSGDGNVVLVGVGGARRMAPDGSNLEGE